MDDDQERPMRCLELAAQQVGPWRKGSLGKHQRAVLALAVMYETFVLEGYTAALAIARDKVRVPPTLNVVSLTKEA